GRGEGVCYRRKDGTLNISPPYIAANEPPDPYTQKYFAALNGRIAYFEASRGCPFSCAFCLSGRCGSVRRFDFSLCCERLLRLANSGTKTIKFVDRTFNADLKCAKAYWRFILNSYGKEIPAGVCFHFEIAGDLLDDEAINLLAQAPKGAFQLEIGMQSFNEATLAAVARRTNSKKLQKNIAALLDAANMHIHIDLIAGLPKESFADFAASFNIGYKLKANLLQLGFLKILHGSPMGENPDKYPCRYSQQPPYEVLSTPAISADELRELHILEDALERFYNSGRFRRTADYCLKQSGLEPFDFYLQLGRAVPAAVGTSLDDYTAALLAYFSNALAMDKAVVRDLLVCDRLASNRAGFLPTCLQVPDPRLRKIKKQLQELYPPRQGIKRAVAFLYSANEAVFVDYSEPDPVTGQFTLQSFKDFSL
ncbi:MAG: DUF4080 domain-containing protein, partial [Clostridia bacterium]|nr:DUF4080 domain-containing protein [Clostridia bacterium]